MSVARRKPSVTSASKMPITGTQTSVTCRSPNRNFSMSQSLRMRRRRRCGERRCGFSAALVTYSSANSDFGRL
jgi:hypothetical protein